MEVEKSLKGNGDSHEVVVSIPGTVDNPVSSKTSGASSRGSADYMKLKPPNVDVKRQNLSSSSIQMTINPSPGISNVGPSPNRPPKPPSESSESSFRRRPVSNSAYSKSKSRLVESQTIPKKPLLESSQVAPSLPPYIISPSSRVSTPKESARKTSGHVTPRTPLMASKEEDDDEDDTEVYISGFIRGDEKKKGKKVKVVILIEWFLFFAILALLISSLTVNKLNDAKIWKVQIWRWSVLALVIFCGGLVTGWFTNLLTFLIEKNFINKRNVMYFLYGLRNSVRIFIWLGFILLTWVLLINRDVERSNDTERAIDNITRGIACTLGGASVWMLKTFFIKLLASTFHVKTFFDRIQESIFHQYVLQTLSGPPLMAYEIGNSITSGQLSFTSTITTTTTTKKGKQKDVVDELVDVDKFYRMKREKVSAWTMSGLIDIISSRGLSTLAGAIDEVDDEGIQKIEITNELEAKACAKRIFKNVAKPGKKYIEEEDLHHFMTREEVDNAFPLFQGAIETGQITKSSFKIWVGYAYNERKCLAHSLNDSKTAVEELNRICSVLVLIVIGIMWLLLMDITTTKVLVFISSQLLILVFMFGNTFKTLFEGIIFNFIVHPFDVGDRCVIDGVEMVVEEMNILTTIFLRNDNEKIYYPISILSTKAISNFNRSPEMSDSVEFAVDFSTSVESIATLKEKIKEYLESKPQQWRPNYNVQLKEIENIDKLKMVLSVTHTMNFQNSVERKNRKSDLVFELKKLFEELGIKYRLPPQELLISYVDSVGQSASSNVVK